MRISDWSSDVCSSDLFVPGAPRAGPRRSRRYEQEAIAPATTSWKESAPMIGRHYGLDWLRVGAFALLIFYHVGMYFVPWGWHVKSDEILPWATVPMFALNPWRLSLLFVVSGYASRAVLGKLAGDRKSTRL